MLFQRAQSAASFFDSSPPNTIRVRLEGFAMQRGIYYVPNGSTVGSVIIMALRSVPPSFGDEAILARLLCDGNVVRVWGDISKQPVITLEMIPVQERMVLGIPLDPSILNEEEWELLPGIGPSLARKIVTDRQDNGAFRSFEDLLRVPGFGPATLEKIRRFF